QGVDRGRRLVVGRGVEHGAQPSAPRPQRRLDAVRCADRLVGVRDQHAPQLVGRPAVGVFDDRVHQVDGGPERVAAVTDEVHWPITTTAPPGKLPNIYAYYR